MSAYVRSGVLMGTPELIRELGGAADELARRAGIDPLAFADPDLPVPLSTGIEFFESAANACACENFGLRLSQRQNLSLLGPLWTLAQSATTLGEMLDDLASLFVLHTTGLHLTLERIPQGLILNYDTASGVGSSPRQTVELGMGLVVGTVRRVHPSWVPSDVSFRHSAPAQLALHHDVLGPRIRFNSDRNAIFLETAILNLPFGSGDGEMHRLLHAQLSRQRKTIAGETRARVEGLIRMLLPVTNCDLEIVARTLRLSSRTLQRSLARDGSSFAEVLDAVRADLARHYLGQSKLSVGEVANILGFSETSALTRAFRRWYGVTPRTLRARTHQDGDTSFPGTAGTSKA